MKILVVDDSNFIKALISKTLQMNIPNLQLITASNGIEGYNLYLAEKPDLIVTDLLMPEMNGWELLQLVRKIDLNVKIIVISADVQKATRVEIDKFNILEFINKPFNNEKAKQLINLVREEFNA